MALAGLRCYVGPSDPARTRCGRYATPTPTPAKPAPILIDRPRRACKACGIEGLHFHDSRATAITRLARVLSPVELARMIGHRDLGSLLVYYRESASSIAERLD